MLVTTSYEPSPLLEAKAQELAVRLRGRWAARQRYSLAKLRSLYNDRMILVLNDRMIKYHLGDEAPVFFHPGTSIIRIKRLQQGETDTLLQVAGIEPGDSVLDCTAGLASDAIVFSFAVGAKGRVTAIESQEVIHLLIKEGLSAYASDLTALNDAMRRVSVEYGDHLAYLQRQEDRSVDVIYFDPMFRHPIEQSSSISPLRPIANDEPLSSLSIQEALRVARKCVVLKEHRDSPEFARLGFRRVHRSYTKIAYGVIPL